MSRTWPNNPDAMKPPNMLYPPWWVHSLSPLHSSHPGGCPFILSPIDHLPWQMCSYCILFAPSPMAIVRLLHHLWIIHLASYSVTAFNSSSYPLGMCGHYIPMVLSTMADVESMCFFSCIHPGRYAVIASPLLHPTWKMCCHCIPLLHPPWHLCSQFAPFALFILSNMWSSCPLFCTPPFRCVVIVTSLLYPPWRLCSHCVPSVPTILHICSHLWSLCSIHPDECIVIISPFLHPDRCVFIPYHMFHPPWQMCDYCVLFAVSTMM